MFILEDTVNNCEHLWRDTEMSIKQGYSDMQWYKFD